MNIRDFIKKQPVLVGVLIMLMLGVVSFMLLMPKHGKSSARSDLVRKGESKEIGISVGGADQQAYMARLEKNYYDFEDRVKEVEAQVKNMQSTASKIEGSQKDIAQSVLKLDQNLGFKMEQKLDDLKTLMNLSAKADDDYSAVPMELSVADINTGSEKNGVYLPLGSFCKGTLLTGVYAAADINNPLPVLISLDEAFYGPNKTRIPLKGAFVLGKAYGELTSERALIQIVAISTVLPSTHVFESEQDLGYVTDEYGELGIKGQLIYNTGRQLALTLMGGLVAGGAQSMADAQVTTHQTIQGDVSRQVTGSALKNSIFSGVAQGAGKLAEHFEKQAQEMIPAIHVKNGATVYFIVQKGVAINGLSTSDFNHQHWVD